jgi:hypothetical protein
MEIRFPVVSSCARCQALSDGRKFFELVEHAAAREDFDADRFVLAMREALSIVEVIAGSLDCDTFENLSSDQVAAIANDAAAQVAAAIIARDPSLAMGHEVH